MRLYPITTFEPRYPMERVEHAGMQASWRVPLGMGLGIVQGLAPGATFQGIREFGWRQVEGAIHQAGPLGAAPRRAAGGLLTQWTRADAGIGRWLERHPGLRLTPRGFWERAGYGLTVGPARLARGVGTLGYRAVRGIAGRATGGMVAGNAPGVLGAGAFGLGLAGGAAVGMGRSIFNIAANAVDLGIRTRGLGLFAGASPAGMVWRAAGYTAAAAAVRGAWQGYLATWNPEDRRSASMRRLHDSTYGLTQALSNR